MILWCSSYRVRSPFRIFIDSLTGGSRNDWQIGDNASIYENEQIQITGGNLVAVDDVGADISPVLQSPNVNIVRASSSSATLQELEDIQIIVNGNRESGKIPSLFSDIHVEYILQGNLEQDKVARAIELSMDKYCSVAKILEKTATITYSFKINP